MEVMEPDRAYRTATNPDRAYMKVREPDRVYSNAMEPNRAYREVTSRYLTGPTETFGTRQL